MLAICVESSHARGMGHLFRSCVLARALARQGREVRVYVNDHQAAIDQLSRSGLAFSVVPLCDPAQDWETDAVAQDGVQLWIYDRHETDRRSTTRVKARTVPIVTFDDQGSGADDADLHIAALALDPDEQLRGRKVLRGVDYLLLDPDIASYRRLRTAASKYIVTMGGADTYGVTPKIVRRLARLGRQATVVIGPAFAHHKELAAAATAGFEIKQTVLSLTAELAQHDIAVTGGGITPFEANAAGLPCIIVANEDFEIARGRALERMGCAVFAGHHSVLDESVFERELDVEKMSRTALENITLDGVRRVVDAILSL